jgi:DNA-directed RNA polymerase specialized sigma24 family protein
MYKNSFITLPYENAVVAKAKAARIPGFTWEDIAQELRTQLWLKKDKFDSTKGVKEATWVDRVLRNKIKDLFEYATYQIRVINAYSSSLGALTEEELNFAVPLTNGEGFYLFDNLAFYEKCGV